MAILRHFLIFVIHQLTHREQLFWGQVWGQTKDSSSKLSIIKNVREYFIDIMEKNLVF